jgi:hypothetical protein
MVHYGQQQANEPVPNNCPSCGSSQADVVGRLQDGKTIIVRCGACRAHWTIMLNTPSAMLTTPYQAALPWVR